MKQQQKALRVLDILLKNGLCNDLIRFVFNKVHNSLLYTCTASRTYHMCFVYYLIKHKYPYIERDAPHDHLYNNRCYTRKGRHFIHHYKGYDDNKDYDLFSKMIPRFACDDEFTFANDFEKGVKFYLKPKLLHYPKPYLSSSM